MANARSVWKLVTFDLNLWPWELFSHFKNSGYLRMALPSNFIFGMERYIYRTSESGFSFECLKLAASFSVWRYIFRIFCLPSSFKVMELVSRSRSQNSGSAQVSAPLRHSIILSVTICRLCLSDCVSTYSRYCSSDVCASVSLSIRTKSWILPSEIDVTW